MDDLYEINVAKSEFREAFNNADPDRMVALADPGVVDFADGFNIGWGPEGLKKRLVEMFEKYTVQLSVIEIEIRIVGDLAYDYGWHVFKFTSKNGSGTTERKDRYVDIWRRNEKGEWKLWMYMDNRDLGPV